MIFHYTLLVLKYISIVVCFWRENTRGPCHVIRTSRQPIRKLHLGNGPVVADPKKNKYRHL